MTQSPIGIFDSGLGGLSISKEIIQLMPQESTIYLADSLNAPYGEKSKEKILEFSIKNTELLLTMGCKIIVVACNTATTNAIKTLREKYQVPFIGIEPAIKPAALTTKTGIVGVLATKGTLNSDLFLTTSSQFGHIDIIEVEGKNLVRLIESGNIAGTKPLLREYLLPMIDKGADNIVLGCTHYPFLIPIIKEILPSNIKIIDSGQAVATQTQNVLANNDLLSKDGTIASHQFYTNGEVQILDGFLNQIELVADYTSFKQF
jgi:glutamate racemase